MSTNNPEIRELTLDEIETVSGGLKVSMFGSGFEVVNMCGHAVGGVFTPDNFKQLNIPDCHIPQDARRPHPA